MTHLLEYSNATFMIDNESVYKICTQKLLRLNPTFSDLNTVIAKCFSEIVCVLDFPGNSRTERRFDTFFRSQNISTNCKN